MLETEIKSVVNDLAATQHRLAQAGAVLRFQGRMEDRRYDTHNCSLASADQVLRVRVYREAEGGPSTRAEVGWKGPTTRDGGYKIREELSAGVIDPDLLSDILSRLGYTVTMAIDREIWEYHVAGASVRFERYPRMDDLVEVEGDAEAIERAVKLLEMPRDGFTSERLPDFARRYQDRTGHPAALSRAELQGTASYDVDNA